MKPSLAISMGDPAGISPEVIVQTLDAACLVAKPVVFGHLPTMAPLLSESQKARLVLLPAPRQVADGEIGFIAVEGCGERPIDTVDDRCGRAQLSALALATDAVLGGVLSALVTAPVAKNAIARISPGFSGHTEYLARRAGLAEDDVTMVFVSETLAVGMVSTHISLRAVPEYITEKRLERTFRHVRATCGRKPIAAAPRVAVAALNPHAGEGGMFGFEETDLLIPFCEKMASMGEGSVEGPVPADAVFRDALAGKLDGVVAMYHDQALIPLKLGGVGQMVNMTMGLPFIRTSPDHGVAYDIARSGQADPSGMKLAITLAVEMVASQIR